MRQLPSEIGSGYGQYGHSTYFRSLCTGKRAFRRYLQDLYRRSGNKLLSASNVERYKCFKGVNSLLTARMRECFLAYCGVSRYCRIRAKNTLGSDDFEAPLNSPSTEVFPTPLLEVVSQKTTTSSMLNTVAARAIWPARYVRSSGDWALSTIEPVGSIRMLLSVFSSSRAEEKKKMDTRWKGCSSWILSGYLMMTG